MKTIAHKTAALSSLVLILLVAACSSDPTGPEFPDVAGTYSGTLTWSLSGAGSIDGSMRIDVVQSNEQVTITGSITLLGESVNLPAITDTINATGFFTATAGGFSSATPDPQCGTWVTTSATINFSGSTARISESATSTFCGTLTVFGTLNR